jgi:hypothetical protein
MKVPTPDRLIKMNINKAAYPWIRRFMVNK